MSGLAGILALAHAPLDPGASAVLRAMADAVAHRGPDDVRYHVEGPLGLAARLYARGGLAGGPQPFYSEDRGVVLVLDGEIYNHAALRAALRDPHADRGADAAGDVVVHLYEELGLDFAARLDGAFALALWDRARRRLVLARDHLGVKPLFYARRAHQLIFGSELKALFAHPDGPRAADWPAAMRCLDHYARGAPPSFFLGVDALPAGTVLVAEAATGAVTTRRYWDPVALTAEEAAADPRSAAQIVAGYHELLAAAVRSRLAGDAAVGLFLSGGLDSAALAALATPVRRCPTFTLLIDTAVGAGDAESALRVARALDLPTQHGLLDWGQLRTAGDAWRRLVWLTETPLCRGEHLFGFHLYGLARATHPGLGAVLSGEGSDEFNGGNTGWWRAAGQAPDAVTWASFVRHMEALEVGDFLTMATQRFGPLLQPAFLASTVGDVPAGDPWGYYVRRNRWTIQANNLWRNDRLAAWSGLAHRLPFLDHRLVEYCLRVPPAHHEALFWDKQILRRAMASALPRELVARPKEPAPRAANQRALPRMLYEMLVANDRALLRQAFGDGADAHPAFRRALIDTYVDAIPHDPEYAMVGDFLLLTNLALLEQMARAAPPPRSEPPFEVLQEGPGSAWAAARAEMATRVARAWGTDAVDLDAALALASGAELIVRHDAAGGALVIVDDVVVCRFDAAQAPWVEVLRRADGTRPLRALLAEVATTEAEVRADLADALERGFVVVAPRG